jgi:tRNA (guanine-N7-)-methyltransferase
MVNTHRYPMPRVRHHVSPQVYLPVGSLSMVPAWYPPVFARPDWAAWFANGKPADVLDIGCGRGALLLGHANANQDQNILGLEVRESLVQWINTVVDGERLANVRALWYSTANGLDWIDTGSIKMAMYLFPDPWPKKRHHKRRAFTPDFLSMVYRVLQPGGCLYLATDRPDVDEYQRAVLAEDPRWNISDCNDSTWPFEHRTDQQMFCDRKGIPYVRYVAQRH